MEIIYFFITIIYMVNCKNLYKIPIVDLSNTDYNEEVYIVIKRSSHKFSDNAQITGDFPLSQKSPCQNSNIYGSNFYIKNKITGKISYYQEMDIYLPVLLINQGSVFNYNYINMLDKDINMHAHGLNTDAYSDGSSSYNEFGEGTLTGRSW